MRVWVKKQRTCLRVTLFSPRKNSQLTGLHVVFACSCFRQDLGRAVQIFKIVRSLRLRCGGSRLLKNRGRLVDFRDAEEDQRRIRSRLQAAIYVVDIDVRLAQARC